jgi:transcriptional regulator with XRE-family HTH domain
MGGRMNLDGEKLKEARERAGLTQVELAARAGVKEITIIRLEKGRHIPRITTIRNLAIALNVAISDLADWEEKE